MVRGVVFLMLPETRSRAMVSAKLGSSLACRIAG